MLQIVDVETLKCTQLSTNSLIKLESSSYPLSWRNSFQISCLSCAFLVIPASLLVLLFYKKLKLMNSYLYYGIKTFCIFV